MKTKKQKRSAIEPGVEIHDHFDGSAHCVQCGGECKLTGGNRIATELIRWMFEALVYRDGYFLGISEASTLVRAGVPVERFKERARQARQR